MFGVNERRLLFNKVYQRGLAEAGKLVQGRRTGFRQTG